MPETAFGQLDHVGVGAGPAVADEQNLPTTRTMATTAAAAATSKPGMPVRRAPRPAPADRSRRSAGSPLRRSARSMTRPSRSARMRSTMRSSRSEGGVARTSTSSGSAWRSIPTRSRLDLHRVLSHATVQVVPACALGHHLLVRRRLGIGSIERLKTGCAGLPSSVLLRPPCSISVERSNQGPVVHPALDRAGRNAEILADLLIGVTARRWTSATATRWSSLSRRSASSICHERHGPRWRRSGRRGVVRRRSRRPATARLARIGPGRAGRGDPRRMAGSHVRSDARSGSKRWARLHALRNVSCTASSASRHRPALAGRTGTARHRGRARRPAGPAHR